MPGTGYVWLINVPNSSIYEVKSNDFFFESWENDEDKPGENGYRKI